MNAAAARFLLGSVLVLRLAAEPAKPPEPVAVRAVPSRPRPDRDHHPQRAGVHQHDRCGDPPRPEGHVDGAAKKKLILADESNRAEFKSDSREVLVDGLRIFLGDKAVLRKGQLYVSRTDFERSLTPLLRPGLGVTVPPAPADPSRSTRAMAGRMTAPKTRRSA